MFAGGILRESSGIKWVDILHKIFETFQIMLRQKV